MPTPVSVLLGLFAVVTAFLLWEAAAKRALTAAERAQLASLQAAQLLHETQIAALIAANTAAVAAAQATIRAQARTLVSNHYLGPGF